MTSTINELADKIYQEGVEKAELEAKKILSEAEKKAANILSDSEQKAAKTIDEANIKSKEIFSGIHNELNSLSDQVILFTKEKITDCILADASQKTTNELLNDSGFVQSFFLELVKMWETNTTSVDDLVVQMSEKQLNNLEGFFTSKVYKSLKLQPQVDISKMPGKGFQIISNKSGFKVSFTDKDFEAFFKSFMKPKVQKYLFETAINE